MKKKNKKTTGPTFMKFRNQYGLLIRIYINQILWPDSVENIFARVSARLLNHF